MGRVSVFVFLFLLAALALAPVQPVQAVHGGQLDEDRHPYVALVEDSQGRSCVATLISPFVLLTASSCFDSDGEPVWVTFSSQLTPPQRPIQYSGIWVPHPDYCLTCPQGPGAGNGPELAVVLLDQEVSWIQPAQLPSLRDFEWLRPGSNLHLVGYKQDQGNGRYLQRYTGSGTMAPFQTGQDKEYFFVDTDRNGKCYREWGGPVLWNGLIVGVVPYAASKPCATETIAYSLNDTRALDFLVDAVGDPSGLKSRHDFR